MKIVFFDAFANIWPQAYPIKLLSDAFMQQGHETITIRCNGVYKSHCVAMSETDTTFNANNLRKALVCRACIQRASILDGNGARTIQLFDHIGVRDYEIAEQQLIGLSNKNWQELKFNNFPVGKIAAYEFVLSHKINASQIPPHLFTEYCSSLKNVVLTILAAERILLDINPDRVLVYNSLYSANHAFISVARQLNIETYTLQGGPHNVERVNSLTAFKTPKDMIGVAGVSEVAEWLKFPPEPHALNLAISHMDSLMAGAGAFAYSAGVSKKTVQEIPQLLDFDASKPTLLAITSSEDEYFAADLQKAIPHPSNSVSVFATQTSWLEWLVNFALRNPELNVIVRIHPRLAPNKRDQIKSTYMTELEQIFRQVPRNFIINWPQDDLSIYDLAQYIDVGLNRRSSAGAELMTFGIPIVLAGDEGLFAFPPRLAYVAASKKEYEDLIFEALRIGRSLNVAILAHRWLGFLFRSTAVALIQGISNSSAGSKRPRRNKHLIRIWKLLVFVYLQVLPPRNRLDNQSLTLDTATEIGDIISLVESGRTGLHQVRIRERFSSISQQSETEIISSRILPRNFT